MYQLKITLKEIEPPIWRRILVPENVTFYKLHKIIQAAFGWQDYHLFNFDFGDVVVDIPDPDFVPGEMYRGLQEFNARRVKITELFGKHKQCVYIYDFGDNWEHDVVLEEVLSPEEGQHYPLCIGGKRSGPPEDVGGAFGYGDFLLAVGDPGHPEHNELLEWAEKDTGGRKFDPEYFYINEVNRALKKIR